METIGRYKLVKKIGAGGMAEVFLARSHGAQGTEKLLVLKKIHPALAQNAKFIDMFVDEAHVAIRLNHTNIVQVYSFEHIEDAYILAMEYVDGTDLLRLENLANESGQRLPFGLAAFVAAEIAKGLDYAHSRCDDNGEPLEIVHRDVSPQNVLISYEGAVKIADFGIARARWLNEDAPGAIKGKFGYMSPEQAQALPVDRRTDIYALGIVLYEMLIGRPVFNFKKDEDPRAAICDTQHLGPQEVDAAVPAALDVIVLKAIAREPDARFQTARDMARALTEYLHSEEEIYDAQALEVIMVEHAARLKPLESGEEDQLETTRVTTRRDQDERVPRALGEIEQRASIAVTGRLEIDPLPARHEVHSELMRLIGEMAFKFGGVLRKDARGFSVHLGFVRSTMEDAILAVRLAHDVLDAARALARDSRLRIRLRLSVCKGIVHYQGGAEVAAQTFEPDPEFVSRCHYLAEMAEDGEIVAGDQVFKLARRDYHFEKGAQNVDATLVAGKAMREPDLFYRIVGTRSRQERSQKEPDQGTFLGREEELLILGQAFDRAKAGRPQIIKLIGEMGIGKTRFVGQFLKRVKPESDVLRAACLFVERDRPMAAAAAAIRAALDIVEGDIAHGLTARLEYMFGRVPIYRTRQTEFLKALLSAPDLLWGKQPEKRRSLVQRAAFGMGVILSLRARKRPVVLVLEDAQWLDGPSIDVLSELALERSTVPVLLLLVGHPATLAGRRIANIEEISLKEMSAQAIREIILERLGTTESMKSIAEQIVKRAHGNPFFANELVDSLIEQKIVVKTSGNGTASYRQARRGIIRLPATMEGIAASRIAALPPSQRTVLRAASAIGASFDEATVEVLVGRSVTEEIAELAREGLLVEMPPEADSKLMYRFDQAMVREAAYEGLEEKDRKRIHRIMAKRLVAGSKEGEAISDARIAWHLEGAGETEAAGSRYVAAGQGALAIYSDRESLKLFDRAIPLMRPNSSERFHAMALREQLLRYVGRFDERATETAEMKRIAVLLDDNALIAEALTLEAQLAYDVGNFDRAARTLTESLEIARRSGNVTEEVEALRLLAFVAIQGGHLFRAVDCADRALAAISASKTPELFLMASVLDVRGYAFLQMGHLADAARPLADALVLFRRLSKHRNESQSMTHLALLARARGELTEALEFLEQAIRIDIRVRATRPRGLKLAVMGAVRVDVGDFEGAYADLADAERICRDNQERMGQAEVELVLARLKIIEERYPEAIEILERIGQQSVVSQSRILLVWHHQLLAMACLGAQRVPSARKLADEAARIALEAGMNGEAIHSGALQGLILAEAGESGEAVSATRRATDMLVMLRRVRDAEQVWWYQALTFDKTGDTYLAMRALEEARRQVSRKRARIRNQRWQAFYDNHPLIRRIVKGL